MKTFERRPICQTCQAYLQDTASGPRCPWAREGADCARPFRRTEPPWALVRFGGWKLTG